jgi:hypothetical protein
MQLIIVPCVKRYTTFTSDSNPILSRRYLPSQADDPERRLLGLGLGLGGYNTLLTRSIGRSIASGMMSGSVNFQ